jgi:hypothetical protein
MLSCGQKKHPKLWETLFNFVWKGNIYQIISIRFFLFEEKLKGFSLSHSHSRSMCYVIQLLWRMYLSSNCQRFYCSNGRSHRHRNWYKTEFLVSSVPFSSSFSDLLHL